MSSRSLAVIWLMAALTLTACASDDEDIDDGSGAGADDSGGGGSDTSTGGSDGGSEVTGTTADCDDRSVSGAMDVSGVIREDTTWSGLIHVTDNVTVREGATLTIEPGTKIIVAVDREIDVGWNSNVATFFADGTADKPIAFCGESEGAGFWTGLRVGSNVTSDSYMRQVLVEDGGGASAALILESPIHIENVEIHLSGSDGLWASHFAQDSANLTVSDAAGMPVALTNPSALTTFPLGGSLSGNDVDMVGLRFSRMDVETIIHALPIPYLQEDEVLVRAGAALTFEAGVEYRFARDTYLDVGWNSNDAEFQVEGTEAEPVVFRGENDDIGSWYGIYVGRNVTSNSTITHAEIHHAGVDGGYALVVHAAVALQDVVLQDNAHGAWISNSGLSADSANLTITSTGDIPLTVEPNALVSLPEGGTFTGNTDDVIAVEGYVMTQTGTVADLGVPYLLPDGLQMRDGAEVTIAPGTDFIMGLETLFEAGWNSHDSALYAVGTAESPITFTGENGQKGDWEGIRIGRNVSSDSELSYVEVGHTGSGNALLGGLVLNRPIAVNNCRFFAGAESGIVRDANDTNDYLTTNVFEDLDGEDVLVD